MGLKISSLFSNLVEKAVDVVKPAVERSVKQTVTLAGDRFESSTDIPDPKLIGSPALLGPRVPQRVRALAEAGQFVPPVGIDIPDNAVRVDVRKIGSGETYVEAQLADGTTSSWTVPAGSKVDLTLSGGEVNIYDGAEVGTIRGSNEREDVRIHNGSVEYLMLEGGDDALTVHENGTISGYATLGDGNDEATIEGTVQVVDGEGDSDTITVRESGTISGRIHGGDGFDQISVKDAATVESIHSGNDNDIVFVEDQSKVGDIYAGSGDDIIEIHSEVGEVHGQSGNDSIRVGGMGAPVVGSIDGGVDNDEIFLFRGQVGTIDGSTGEDTVTLYGAEGDYTVGEDGVRHNLLGEKTGQLDSVETTSYFDLLGSTPTSAVELGTSFGQGNILRALSLAQRLDVTEAQLLGIADFFAAAGEDVPPDIFRAILASPASTSEVIDQALPSYALTDPDFSLLLAYHPNTSEETKAALTDADNGIRIEGDEIHLLDGEGESLVVHNVADNTVAVRHVHDDHPTDSDFAVFEIMDDGTLQSSDSSQFTVFDPTEHAAADGPVILEGGGPVLLEGDPEDYAYQGFNDEGHVVYQHIDSGVEIHVPDENVLVSIGTPVEGEQRHRGLSLHSTGLRYRGPGGSTLAGGRSGTASTFESAIGKGSTVAEEGAVGAGEGAAETALGTLGGILLLVPAVIYNLHEENQEIKDNPVGDVADKYYFDGVSVAIPEEIDIPELRTTISDTYDFLREQGVPQERAAQYIQRVLDNPSEILRFPKPNEATSADLTRAFLTSIDNHFPSNSVKYADQYTDTGVLSTDDGLSLALPAKFDSPVWHAAFTEAYRFMLSQGQTPTEANAALANAVLDPELQNNAYDFYEVTDPEEATKEATYLILVSVDLAGNGNGLGPAYAAVDGVFSPTPTSGSSPGTGPYAPEDIEEFAGITEDAAIDILFDELATNSPENVAQLLQDALDDPERVGTIIDGLVRKAEASESYDGGERLNAVRELFLTVFDQAVPIDDDGNKILPDDPSDLLALFRSIGPGSLSRLTEDLDDPYLESPLARANAGVIDETTAQLLESMTPQDKARFLSGMSSERAADVLRAAGADRAAAILADLVQAGHATLAAELLNALGSSQDAADIVKRLDPADAAKALEAMTPEEAEEILAELTPDEAAPILSAGSIDLTVEVFEASGDFVRNFEIATLMTNRANVRAAAAAGFGGPRPPTLVEGQGDHTSAYALVKQALFELFLDLLSQQEAARPDLSDDENAQAAAQATLESVLALPGHEPETIARLPDDLQQQYNATLSAAIGAAGAVDSTPASLAEFFAALAALEQVNTLATVALGTTGGGEGSTLRTLGRLELNFDPATFEGYSRRELLTFLPGSVSGDAEVRSLPIAELRRLVLFYHAEVLFDADHAEEGIETEVELGDFATLPGVRTGPNAAADTEQALAMRHDQFMRWAFPEIYAYAEAQYGPNPFAGSVIDQFRGNGYTNRFGNGAD